MIEPLSVFLLLISASTPILFAALAGAKTLTRANLERIEALGYEVEVERNDHLMEELE